jgi:pectate lyase
MLDLPASVDPVFTVDAVGSHVTRLLVDGYAAPLSPDTVAFTMENVAPVANTWAGLVAATHPLLDDTGQTLAEATSEAASLSNEAPSDSAASIASRDPVASSGSTTFSDEHRETRMLVASNNPASPGSSARVSAFPGCGGSGCAAIGGRGGSVIEVTNLDDSGTGSLRACVEAPGPRTCVFRVGGTIELQSKLSVWEPYLTVAGQTAPGDGILLTGTSIGEAHGNDTVQISAHDVIWRYTRVRVGYNEDCADGAESECGSGFVIGSSGDVYNIVVDHNSVSWNQDEGIGVWRNYDNLLRDITISWNLLAEPLKSHPTSLITGANNRALADGLTDVDIHHNLVISADYRNPLAKNKTMRLINNIFYNYSFYATQFGGGVIADIVGNYYRAGPDTDSAHEVQAFPGGNSESANGTLSLYLAGNKGPNQADPDTDNWSEMTAEVSRENGSEIGALSDDRYRRATPMPARYAAIPIDHVDDLEDTLLPTVGASRRLDCDGTWVAARDLVDTRLIHEYETGSSTGFLIVDESAVGGFPTINGGTSCPDTDHDGMPDSWEVGNGLDPSNAEDRNGDRDGDGYTNLEEFLNG